LLWPLPDTSPPLPLATIAADPKKKKKNDIAKKQSKFCGSP